MIGGAMQRAIYAALTVEPAIAGGRIYDRPPADASALYVTIGDEQVIDEGNSCSDVWDVVSDIHVWSRPASGSKLEAKEAAAAIVARLGNPAIDVAGFAVMEGALETQRSFRDQDGLTEHIVVTVRHTLFPL